LAKSANDILVSWQYNYDVSHKSDFLIQHSKTPSPDDQYWTGSNLKTCTTSSCSINVGGLPSSSLAEVKEYYFRIRMYKDEPWVYSADLVVKGPECNITFAFPKITAFPISATWLNQMRYAANHCLESLIENKSYTFQNVSSSDTTLMTTTEDNPVQAGDFVRASHVIEMRAAVQRIYDILATAYPDEAKWKTPITWTDSLVISSVTEIKPEHFQQIREKLEGVGE
jgi:hypothetical protein